MVTPSISDALAMSGGLVDPDNCPKTIPPRQYIDILQTFASLGQHYEDVMNIAGVDYPCMMAMTLSPGFSCKVRQVKEGYAILVPAGVPARIHVLTKLLIQYWGNESQIHIIRSPLDKIPWDFEAIPPKLRPIFSEDFEDDVFWQELEALDKSLEINALQEVEALELTHLALVYLISHEFSHIKHGHFELLQNIKDSKYELSEDEIKCGLEIDADAGASSLSMYVLNQDIQKAQQRGEPAQMELAWLRLSYAITMIYAISDAHQKHFSAYENSTYSHPMVRCELFFSSVERAMSSSTDEAKKLWLQNSTEGWRRCIWAFNDLSKDAMAGKFGPRPDGVPRSPLHTLLYSMSPMSTAERIMLEDCDKAMKLMYKVRKLLPAFNKQLA